MPLPEVAMILAAGFGTRLRPLTYEEPKALLEIGGRPMIEYPLRMLAAAGVHTVVINLHHLGQRIRDTLGDGSRFGVRIEYSPEDPILDTGGALARARRWLSDCPFFLVNCDALLDLDLADLARFHERHGALATLAVRRDPAADRYGPIDLDADGRIRRFLGQPPATGESLERRMFCGLHLLSPEIFAAMPREGVFSITRDVYAGAHARGEPLFGYRYDGYWRDLGTPEALEAARSDLESGRFAPTFLQTPVDG